MQHIGLDAERMDVHVHGKVSKMVRGWVVEDIRVHRLCRGIVEL